MSQFRWYVVDNDEGTVRGSDDEELVDRLKEEDADCVIIDTHSDVIPQLQEEDYFAESSDDDD